MNEEKVKILRIVLVIVSVAALVGTGIAVIVINADLLPSSPEKVFDNFYDAYKNNDVKRVGMCFFSKKTQQYTDFVKDNTFFGTYKLPQLIESSSYEITTHRDGNNNTTAEVGFKKTGEVFSKLNITFDKKDTHWFIRYDAFVNSYQNVISGGDNNGNNDGNNNNNNNNGGNGQALRIPDKTIKDYTVPSGAEIDGETFKEAKDLVEVTFPADFTFVQAEWFAENTKLTRIIIDENSQHLSSDNGVVFSKDKTVLVYYPAGKIQTGSGEDGVYIIPHTVTKINANAFKYVRGLKKVITSENLTSIGNGAFSNAVHLESVILFDGLRSIGNDAFLGGDIVRLTVPKTVVNIGNNVFKDCGRLLSVTFDKDTELEIMGYAAFENCIALETVTLPDSLKTIGSWTFQNCANLKTLVLPADLQTIGLFAFRQCYSLEKIFITNEVTVVERGAFQSCFSLEINIEHANIPTTWNSEWKAGFEGTVNLGAKK